MPAHQPPPRDTSWNSVAQWYGGLVGTQGHYYHQHVIVPNLTRLLDLHPQDSLVDFGCGQGFLADVVQVSRYLGLDAAPTLIAQARQRRHPTAYEFEVQDVTKKLHRSGQERFSHGVFVLSLQNMEHPDWALKTAAELLQPGGRLVVVLNHPCFRIPRQSGWGIDERSKLQYRWVNRYRSPLKIPIEMQPGNHRSKVTWSFHYSLHDFAQMIAAAGFSINNLEEWTSDKESEGKAAKMENRARAEFPMFLALVCQRRL
jgi:SAM-dependent methyltransferase